MNGSASAQSGKMNEENKMASMFDYEYLPETNAMNGPKEEEMMRVMNIYACELREKLISSSKLYEKLDHCSKLSDGIMNRQTNLVKRSIEVSANCERLADEVQILTKHADEIGAPLKHYDAIDRVGLGLGVLFKQQPNAKDKSKKVVTVRGLAKVKVDDEEEFMKYLNEVDDACVYFANSLSGAEHEKEYGRRALILQEAAIFLLKEAVVDRLKQTTADIKAALNLDKKGTALPADKLEASLIYTRFHGISSRSYKFISILQERSNINDTNCEVYRELLKLCQTTYCISRESLLQSSVASHIESLRIEHGIVGMTRLASSFLERLCGNEVNLYRDFFGSYNVEKKNENRPMSGNSALVMSELELQKMLNVLCSVLHRSVRKDLVQLADIDTLCQVVSVLKEESGSISESKTSTIAQSRTMSGVIKDAQERLIYIAQRSLQVEVMKFKAKPEHLDYPNKLTGLSDKKSKADPIQAQLLVYDSWYPPLRSVLRVLSKLFRVVDEQVFEDIALQSVQGCTKCLKDASQRLERLHKGSFDSDLFLIKHLLILREQLSPFDIELKSIQRSLDFSEAGKAVANFLANRNRHILSMSNENALVMLIREGVSIQESSVDSKRDLEEALRQACNTFIESGSEYIVENLVGFVESCKDFASTDINAVIHQKFMNGDDVKKNVLETKAKIEEKLLGLSNQIELYLENSGTKDILMKPITSKSLRIISDAKRFTSMAKTGVNGWDVLTMNDVDLTLGELKNIIDGNQNKT